MNLCFMPADTRIMKLDPNNVDGIFSIEDDLEVNYVSILKQLLVLRYMCGWKPLLVPMRPQIRPNS